MLTAETIADEQIRELRSSLRIRPSREISITECDVALDDSDGELARLARRLSRTRCAEILNARAKEASNADS
jgi:DNA relaxase NicK